MPRLAKITTRQKELLNIIYNHIAISGFPPTFDEMKLELDVSSNQAVIDFLNSLEGNGFIERQKGSARGILICEKGYRVINKPRLIEKVGVAAAGPAIEAIEQNEWVAMPSGHRKYDDVFIVEISGNSMIGIGIYDRDKVLIKKSSEYKNGDIVLARIGDEVTLKTFVHEDGRVYLKPENPACRNIAITHETFFLGKFIKNLGKQV